MRVASYQQSGYRYRPSPGSRAVSIGLALAIAILIVVMLIRLGILAPLPPKVDQRMVLMQLHPDTTVGANRSRTIARPHRSGGAAPKSPAPKPATKQPPVVKAVPWNVIPMSKDEFAASDISTKPSHQDEGASAGTGAGKGAGTDSGDAEGKGDGPGGERVYNAEWYGRPPGGAQLATYKPPNRTGIGWGEVICKTIPDYRVEDCRELGESPGSGLSRMLREASWQFRVRPVRIGDRSLVGIWVRIHYTMTEGGPADAEQ